jgi:hypothetical protein
VHLSLKSPDAFRWEPDLAVHTLKLLALALVRIPTPGIWHRTHNRIHSHRLTNLTFSLVLSDARIRQQSQSTINNVAAVASHHPLAPDSAGHVFTDSAVAVSRHLHSSRPGSCILDAVTKSRSAREASSRPALKADHLQRPDVPP